jgi:CDGSH-type Zn-finger protein/truncated hemoglobin YjbI/ferredoxin
VIQTSEALLAQGRDLLARAVRLERDFGARAAGTDDEGRRAVLARVAGRLAASVVRPLAVAVGEPSVLPDGPAPEVARLTAQVYELARDATGLRARLGGPPGLLEATAALQDLACQPVASDAEALSARRAKFAALQAEVPASIQSAPDGPYLVTNVPQLYDWLGVSLDALPQAALCRCGASQIKPWCDGSHAQIGFRAAKDPQRVPDRLDTYPGQGATIADNRGTCAHSGLCTDRLPTVFRTDQEPFVAPNGGRLDEIIRAARDCPSGALGITIDGPPIGNSRAPGQADQDRPPGIEVCRDGPYRVTGGVALLDGQSRPEPRNAGASSEHYCLCRCGKSANKPFCSGMHRYADFHDPPMQEQPSLFAWVGGFPALLRLTRRFYETYIPEDPLLAPLFARMSPDHPQRVAAWLGEVFGGPKSYSERYGGYERMIGQHVGKELQEAWRARWVQLMCRAADDVGWPADPEFRAAFVAYLEWGSRLAAENSQPGAEPPPHMPVPRWWWVCDAYPWSRTPALRTDEPDDADHLELPGPDQALSFAAHIKPLFRKRDRDSMRFAFDLWSRDDVATHATAILGRLTAGTMPCDIIWPPERIALLKRWIDTGKSQ